MNPMTEIEQEIQAKGLTAPRVTPERIESVIASEHYFTAAQGDAMRRALPEALGLLTLCVLVLANGFTVTGESACASPENFNADLGRKIARAAAVNKIWPLEGYLLRQQLHEAAKPTTPKQRVETERDELQARLAKLNSFLARPDLAAIVSADGAILLARQQELMTRLLAILNTRLDLWEPK